MTQTAIPETLPGAPPLRDASWDEIRELFMLTPNAIHLNTGTIGAMPYEVLDTMDQVTRAWTGGLMDVYPPGMYTGHRERIARSFGVDQDEMVITHNATEGVARVINGLDLHEGDEVVTTTHECYSVLSNFNLVRNRHGITVKALTLPSGYDVRAEEIVDLFERAIGPRTKVLAFAGVTLFTGTLLPIRALCELAHRHGLITVIDGALLPGMLDCDMRALGADFISCSGSKFQCGPLGTGLLYVRNKVVPSTTRCRCPRCGRSSPPGTRCTAALRRAATPRSRATTSATTCRAPAARASPAAPAWPRRARSSTRSAAGGSSGGPWSLPTTAAG
nr:aminotransferase class V-fold PLP-dependent enzyme [Phytohabitans suffuscus]